MKNASPLFRSKSRQFHFEADTKLVSGWNEQFGNLIAGFALDWGVQYPSLAKTVGLSADEAGAALARAWIRQVPR